MEVAAGALEQPGVDEGRFVRGVVVEDEVDLQGGIGRYHLVDGVEKGAKLHGPMLGKALADDGAGGDVKCRKQGGGAVAKIVGRVALGLGGQERQDRLRTFQRLNLTFLIHAQHQRVGRRAQVCPGGPASRRGNRRPALRLHHDLDGHQLGPPALHALQRGAEGRHPADVPRTPGARE